ncbi:pro-neuregulin-2, membrane-bound isoform-like [Callorhinchus milii]|uniref:pro-neuregulin-2, membrane-bound isoform-like n=1 Tax=Callorhinchus milii TaxID=7868 RepID=UPI001C3FE075|nr:pro-neuregulin-2, membrane-bound isoform-like [Callorhinchus milii]
MPWTLTQGLLSLSAEPFTVHPLCLPTGQHQAKPQPTGSPTPPAPTAAATTRMRRMMMRRLVDAAQLTMLLITGVSLACYPSPSPQSWQDQAHRSAVVIEGKVQSMSIPNNNSPTDKNSNSQHNHHHHNGSEPYSVSVKVLDVWPVNSAGLQRNQLITIGDFGSEAPCVQVKKNQKYIFFMNLTDQPLVFKTSFAPLDSSSGKNLKKDVEKILCQNCEPDVHGYTVLCLISLRDLG